MKRKGHPNIPDYSSKRHASPKVPDANVAPKRVTPTTPARSGKPQSTSAKSGRRGI
jgi:hypothetical protein